jgi:predicted RNA-binding protein Jag
VTSPRRFFWGRSLAQALARAARHHGVAPDRLDYRLSEKRHGFVKHPRAVLIEVDPQHPELQSEIPQPATEIVARPAGASERDRTARVAERAPRSESASPAARRGASRAEGAGDSTWEVPDADSEIAAAEAASKLLAFAGLDLEVAVRRTPERLELELSGADDERLRQLGTTVLEAIEVLLPRAVVSLSGRHVRCRVDGAGLRAAFEEELRRRARELAHQVEASGTEELLEPLGPAERRIVHLELEPLPGVATESLGHGFEKRVRIYVVPPAVS